MMEMVLKMFSVYLLAGSPILAHSANLSTASFVSCDGVDVPDYSFSYDFCEFINDSSLPFYYFYSCLFTAV